MRIRFVLLAAALLAAPAAAQKSAAVYEWNEEAGWSAEADGVSHNSGLKCPSTAWQGLGDTAPVAFDNDSFGEAKVDASCQYYTYWDATLATETRLVVNIVKVPDTNAYIRAWGPQMMMLGEPELGELVRDGATYRLIRWMDDEKHYATLVIRADMPDLVLMIVQPVSYDDDDVWPVLEALYRANS